MAASAVWSVHDIAAGDFPHAQHVVRTLEGAGLAPICLLVVPDGDWTDGQLATLRGWERAGHILGLHGWSHRAPAPRTLYHRAHAAVLSRDSAEHLALSAGEIAARIECGRRWCEAAGLAPPRLYVPPAWAMGALPLRDLAPLPFDWVETLTGVYHVRSRRHRRLPLLGFEADTVVRALALRASNRANAAIARATGRPLRIAVHPRDLELRLAGDLRRLLRRPPAAVAPGDA